MEEKKEYDLVVIGSGPAGYAAAIRAGQLGKKVACIEEERTGGTCLNWGCIPSKAILKAAELYETMQKADTFGLCCVRVGFNFEKVIGRSRGVVDTMGKGIEFLFKKNKVEYIKGRATVSVPEMVEVTKGKDKGKVFSAKNILLATGCKARRLPDVEVDGERVMTSREALTMKRLPKSIVILGAGAIGVEFAYFLSAFGSKVTLIERLPQVLPIEDEEVASALSRSFKQRGIDIQVDTMVESVKVGKKAVTLDLNKKDGKTEKIEAESLLISIGLVADTEGLLSKKVKVDLDRGYIKVNDRYETNVKGVYAAGDIIGPPWLAHIATYEALQAVNGMFGIAEPNRAKKFPSCTYCQPQVASIGLTEKGAKEQGLKYKVSKFPFSASGKAMAVNHPEGFVKLIVDEQYGEILGAHIIGSYATELIAEYELAIGIEATAEDIHHTIHAHPTMSEALMEASAAVYGEAIHV